MNPEIVLDISRQRSADLLDEAERRRKVARIARVPAEPVIRLAGEADLSAIARLAQLEGRRVPDGQHLVAEVDREVRAALSIDTAEAVADPFHHTAGLVVLLQRRRARLLGQDRPTGLRRFTRWPRRRPRHDRVSSGSSAPAVPGSETSLIR